MSSLHEHTVAITPEIDRHDLFYLDFHNDIHLRSKGELKRGLKNNIWQICPGNIQNLLLSVRNPGIHFDPGLPLHLPHPDRQAAPLLTAG